MIKQSFPMWFGKKCKHQCCQWEDSEEIAGPNWKEYEPVLIYCNHADNHSETEGNCTELRCPETVITIVSSEPETKWIEHKAPFVHIGNNIMKCPMCGLEGKGDVFAHVSCIIKEKSHS